MSAFVDDIRGQGGALRELAGHADEVGALVDELELGSFDRIVLSGMGGSHYAAYPAWLALVGRGLPAWWVDTAELLHDAAGLVGGRTLLWLTSQSGESAEIVELLRGLRASSRPTVVGLTNTPESTLAEAADHVVLLHAGDEQAVSTKTFVNTLGAFSLAVATDRTEAVGGLGRAAAALDDWAGSLDAAVERAAALLDGPAGVVIVGRGRSLAAARAGALTIKEAAKTHAEALGSGAFRHGPVELAGPGLAVIVLAGDARAADLNRALAADVAGYGSPVAWVGDGCPEGVPALASPGVDSAFGRQVAEIAALQACSVALAGLHGIEPGVFRFATKVTTVQ